jgi:ZIP family zinc transporter
MNISYSFFLTILAGLSTLLGVIIIFIPNKNKSNIIVSSLSFASGVMICISIIDLIPESLSLLKSRYNFFISIMFSLIFFCIGVIVSMFTDKYIPKKNNNLYKIGIVSMIAIILHNIPEGIITFMASSMNKKLGISLAISIAMHNIPEGISISIPIYYGTNSKKKSFFYTLISGLSEPFGALIAFIFLQKFINNLFMGLLFSFIAGIMIQISLYELIPEAKSYNKNKLVFLFIILGIIFMSVNHIFF